jgi:hypothetical protein
MDKKAWVVIAVTVSGCVTPIGDLTRGDFSSIQAEAPPQGIIGTWTGSSGPYLVTLKIGDDGSGVMCSSYGGKDILQRAKYNAGNIITQDGARAALASAGATAVTMEPRYSGSKISTLNEDVGLTKASLPCVKLLRELG